MGKTTLLNHLFEQVESKNKVKLDLENPLHRRLFEEEDYDNVWNNLAKFGITKKQRAYLFIDEIQNLPEISRVAKYLYDHWDVKFFLTGSSSFYLKNLFPESLAGRKLIYELFPLTFQEFLIFKGSEYTPPAGFSRKAQEKSAVAYERYHKLYEEFFEYGGFPEVVLEEDLTRKQQLLEEVFQSYFEQDVRSLADFRNVSKLRDLILLLIPRVGSKLDVSKLSSNLKISRETVYSQLAFLEKTYFIKLLPQYSKSIDRQAAGSKKVYLCDTGLANVLGQISSGQSFESGVFQSLRPKHELAYYQKNSKEIDFIVDGKVALEVKETATQRDLQTLQARSQSLGLSKQYVVSRNWSEMDKVILAMDL